MPDEGIASSEVAFDVVVIGGGTAGLSTAIAASESGLRVCILEAENRLGGSLHVSAGQMSAAGTKAQAAAGIADHPDLHYADVLRIGGTPRNDCLLRRAIDQAPVALDWLLDSGLEMAPGSPGFYYGHEPYSRPRTHFGLDGGLSILGVLLNELKQPARRDRFDVRLGLRVEDITRDDSEYWLVHALRIPKTEQAVGESGAVRARSIVFASGGYGSNARVYSELTGFSDVHLAATIGSANGDCLRIVKKFRGVVSRGECQVNRLGPLEMPSGRADFWEPRAELGARNRLPREVWVNIRGKRFVDERSHDVTEQEHAVMGQPQSLMWVVGRLSFVTRPDPLITGWNEAEWLDKAGSSANVNIATTVHELAEKCSIDAMALHDSVTTYNSETVHRSEPEWTIPLQGDVLIALKIRPTILATFGGVEVDDECRVLDAGGQPVKGLFGVGEVLGAESFSGRAFCGGMLVTPALALGRWLGLEGLGSG